MSTGRRRCTVTTGSRCRSCFTLFWSFFITLAKHHEGDNTQDYRHSYRSTDDDDQLFLATAFSYRLSGSLLFLGHVIPPLR
jgi:hypothetical protein